MDNITKKLQSRKFFVFLMWTIMIITTYITTKSIPPTEMISWYGVISIVYIGGQTYIDLKDKISAIK